MTAEFKNIAVHVRRGGSYCTFLGYASVNRSGLLEANSQESQVGARLCREVSPCQQIGESIIQMGEVMCCTCDANQLIEAHTKGQTVTFTWPGVPEVVLEVEAVGDKAERAPAKVRLRKGQEAWSAWFDTNDLASTMLRLGTDVHWEWVRDEIKKWLTGSGDLDLSILEAP